MAKSCQIIALFFLCFMHISSARAIEIQFPVACRIMTDCWITNHVDLDKRSGHAEDYMCGQKTTDGSGSTHISLGSFSDVKKNIPVIAAQNGIVEIARDVGGFCGQRILIDHGGGWQSNYCHLKPSTLVVHEGQSVKQGQILGAIGMSGQTKWPHVSYALIRNGLVFDPFSGATALEGCSKTSHPLWINKVNPLYEPAQVTSIGFTVGEVQNNPILYGTMKPASVISKDTPQLSLYGLLMNIKKNDKITLKVTEPTGRVLNETTITSPIDKEYYPIYFSTRRKNILWDAGQYHGTITVTRDVHGNIITTGKFADVELR